MSTLRSRAVASLSIVMLGTWCAAACGARTPTYEGAAPPAAVDVVIPSAPDERCLGAPGCGTPWTCTAAPGCRHDLLLYCGCDGRTHAGGSDCPNGPYARRGPCNPMCAASDARAEGDCDRTLGYTWDGFSSCLALVGCRCVGAACGGAGGRA